LPSEALAKEGASRSAALAAPRPARTAAPFFAPGAGAPGASKGKPASVGASEGKVGSVQARQGKAGSGEAYLAQSGSPAAPQKEGLPSEALAKEADPPAAAEASAQAAWPELVQKLKLAGMPRELALRSEL